ncbi:MAG: hypothetical protein ABFD08_12230 [Syntrophomonas sp.]
MNTTEQSMQKLCPVIQKTVKLRIIYDVAMSKACPVWAEPIFIECSEESLCQACRAKDVNCLLLYENMPLCGMDF